MDRARWPLRSTIDLNPLDAGQDRRGFGSDWIV